MIPLCRPQCIPNVTFGPLPNPKNSLFFNIKSANSTLVSSFLEQRQFSTDIVDTLLFRSKKGKRLKILLWAAYAQLTMAGGFVPMLLLNGSPEVSMLMKTVLGASTCIFAGVVVAGTSQLRKRYVIEAALDGSTANLPNPEKSIIFGQYDWKGAEEYVSVKVQDLYPVLGWPHLESTKKMVKEMAENGKTYDPRTGSWYILKVRDGNSFILEMPNESGNLSFLEQLISEQPDGNDSFVDSVPIGTPKMPNRSSDTPQSKSQPE